MQIVCTDPPYSFFSLSKKYFDPKPLKRILSLMRDRRCRTLIIDDKHTHQCDLASLKLINESPYRYSAERWYFFSDRFGKLKKLKSHTASFLGCATIIREEYGAKKRCYVAEAVVGLDSNPNDSFFVHSKRTFEFAFQGSTLKVQGSYFCQQQGQTDCCAHAAFRVAAFNVPAPINIDIPRFNQICGIDHVKKDAKAVPFNDLLAVINQSGLKPFAYLFDKKAPQPIAYDHLAYYALESGYPVIIAFNTALLNGHVVTAVGHTFNKSTWLPEAEQDYFQLGQIGYIRSVGWVNNFVIQDDNYGPYYCIPTKSIEDKVMAIIAVTDMDHNCYGDQAELTVVGFMSEIINGATQVIGREPFWTTVLREHWAGKRAVFRTLYVEKEAYIRSLAGQYESGALDALKQNLPARFWLTEASVPELFQITKGKIGDVIVDPHSVKIAAIRLPGLVFVINTKQPFLNQMDNYLPLFRR